jgi:hypothetical protein
MLTTCVPGVNAVGHRQGHAKHAGPGDRRALAKLTKIGADC